MNPHTGKNLAIWAIAIALVFGGAIFLEADRWTGASVVVLGLCFALTASRGTNHEESR